MEEREMPPITITGDDIRDANMLSLHCPICGSPVENYVEQPELVAVECVDCETLYHKTCWEQAGGKCAMIGCASTSYRLHAQDTAPVLTIDNRDLRHVQPVLNGSPRENKRLKEQERELRDEVYGKGIFRRFFEWLLNQIRLLDE
ncbi:MAG: hypothetical protein KDD89_03530 [Anaerolineales bacterium]|nr:hypothetical protein [Anaerolineales bacterium]